jgi:hypothetical protein
LSLPAGRLGATEKRANWRSISTRQRLGMGFRKKQLTDPLVFVIIEGFALKEAWLSAQSEVL